MSKDNQIFRIDRNISQFPIKIQQAYGDDSELIFSLLCYFAKQYQQSLFDFGVLDPVEFAKEFKYSRGFLRMVHKSPRELKGLKSQQKEELYRLQEENPISGDYKIFDSVLENALYLMYTQAVVFGSTAQFNVLKDGDTITQVNLQSIRFLNELKIILRKSPRGKSKVYYQYTLDESFINNLNLLYCSVDTGLIKLRRSGLTALYLNLSNLKNIFISKGVNNDVVEFNYLCSLANINIKNIRDRKQRLKQAIQKINDETLLKVKIVFERKKNHNFNYQARIFFEDAIALDYEKKKQEKTNILYVNFLREITDSYKLKYGQFQNFSSEQEKNNILFDYAKGCQIKEIQQFYINAQIKTFKKHTDKKNVHFNKFYIGFQNAKSWYELKDFFKTSSETKLTLTGVKGKLSFLEEDEVNPDKRLDKAIKLLKKNYKEVQSYSFDEMQELQSKCIYENYSEYCIANSLAFYQCFPYSFVCSNERN